ncbi:MAG: T9SS type A sorting domain-containing protein [Bacteroidota bacterium]
MRNFTLALVLCITTSMAFAQSSVARKNVVVEISTGTWCQFCPGSALGADDLHANGHEVAIVEHHNSDAFETPESAYRNDDYYGSTAYPTAYFDGQNKVEGGSQTNTSYPSYLPRFNSAFGVASPIDMTVDFVNPVGNTYDLQVIVDQVATVPGGSNLVLHVVITESHIPSNWHGMNEVNFVNRMMMPDQFGFPLTLAVGSSDTVNHTFNLPSNYDKGNCELVCFVQDVGTKIIHQATVNIVDLASIPINAGLVSLLNPIQETYCDNSIAPEIMVANQEGPAMTELDIEYSVNGGTPMMYQWTGYVESGDSVNIALPSIAFTPVSQGNNLEIDLIDPNGLSDVDGTDNKFSTNWNRPSSPSGTYQVEIKLDNYGSEITWEAVDASGAVIGSGGPYADNSTALITETFEISNVGDCYRFEIKDSWGDGLQWQNIGYFNVYDPSGGILLSSPDGDFGAGANVNFEASWTTSIEQLAADAFQVFPNPNAGVFTVRLAERPSATVEMSVYQLNGQLLKTISTNAQEQQFDLSDQPAGLYLVKVRTEEGLLTQKITKN